MTNEGADQTSETERERQRDEVDTVLSALSDPYRRHALYYLREREGASVSELVTVLTGWLNAHESRPQVANPEQRRRVAIALRHSHLPKLAECGFVGYDSDSETVELETTSESLDAYLDLSLEVERTESDASQTTKSTPTDEHR